MNAKQLIAHRVALELQDGDVVNLGIGIPTQVVNYLPDNIHVTLQSENGFLGLGPITEIHPNLVNAGGKPCGIRPGASMFDSAFSFALIRGGHVNTCVLGALQVDQHANLASWTIPGKMVSGMGGAMDLVTGARKVIIAMEHCTKDGSAKIVKQCTLPLTAINKVSMIVTELGVFYFEQGQLILKEHTPNVTPEVLREKTEAEFSIAHDLKVMPIPVQENGA
ncbi:3-oxoacid CoA-transferase subunit B [Photorhabdus heterorhabditis]|uniref:3-oxoacid CoA-transferase subunit B n=1 Tax=Photorhabdus heterorhabditis TaxID=880156 RepID=UPI001561CF6D|nr:3-oxoacid CoA-transferase subunit B [Photorhabdus heterorhabditis]NRN30083.1 CoA transferase subunit B [Photorhabdus heterorhabditis subsp. aluminescens]